MTCQVTLQIEPHPQPAGLDNGLMWQKDSNAILFKRCFLLCLSHTHRQQKSLILVATAQGSLA